jgi:SAM-dependent methyltransferase
MEVTVSHSSEQALQSLHYFISQKFTGKQARIYEAGGGSSSYLPPAVLRQAEIVVVDIDEEQLKRNTYATTKILGDIQQVSFPKNRFNLITCYNVLEHLKAPDVAVRRFSEALAPAGLLVIGAPNPRSFSGFAARLAPHWFHVWYYRFVLHLKDAGKPGHGPFPIVYHPVVDPDVLINFAATHGLTPKHCELYESSTFSLIKMQRPWVGKIIYALLGVMSRLVGKRNLLLGDYHIVFEKTAAAPEVTHSAAPDYVPAKPLLST